jgi:hypothetical protein
MIPKRLPASLDTCAADHAAVPLGRLGDGNGSRDGSPE